MISRYHPESQYTVYNHKHWWSDAWNPLEYGATYNLSRSFFEQFHELQKRVPRTSLILPGDNENSDYANDTASAKNCYMVTNGWLIENCYYSYAACFGTRDCMDCNWIVASENCYECCESEKLFDCQYVTGSRNCQHSQYCRDIDGLSYCFGCVGLVNAKYHLFNIPLEKEEYIQEVTRIMQMEKSARESYIAIEMSKLPALPDNNIGCEDCIGNTLRNCKNLRFCYNMFEATNCSY